MTRANAAHRLMACTGKVRFDSYAIADKARARGTKARNVYHCRICGSWHVGTSKPKSSRLKPSENDAV